MEYLILIAMTALLVVGAAIALGYIRQGLKEEKFLREVGKALSPPNLKASKEDHSKVVAINDQSRIRKMAHVICELVDNYEGAAVVSEPAVLPGTRDYTFEFTWCGKCYSVAVFDNE